MIEQWCNEHALRSATPSLMLRVAQQCCHWPLPDTTGPEGPRWRHYFVRQRSNVVTSDQREVKLSIRVRPRLPNSRVGGEYSWPFAKFRASNIPAFLHARRWGGRLPDHHENWANVNDWYCYRYPSATHSFEIVCGIWP
jgi:hypothetical protein